MLAIGFKEEIFYREFSGRGVFAPHLVNEKKDASENSFKYPKLQRRDFKHPTNPKPTHSRNVQVRTCPFPFSLFPVLGNTQKLATWSCSPIPGFPPGSLTDIWVVSTSWLLWLVLLWPFVCKFLCRHMFSFLLGMNLGVELLGHMVTQCLVMSGPARLFLLWLHHFTPPPTPWGSHFLHILNAHGYEVVSISLCFRFTNLWWLVMVNIFPCALWPFVFRPWRSLFRSFAYFLIGSFAFTRIPWQEFFTCSADKSLIRHKIGKYFLPFCGLAFHFLEREQKQPIEES